MQWFESLGPWFHRNVSGHLGASWRVSCPRFRHSWLDFLSVQVRNSTGPSLSQTPCTVPIVHVGKDGDSTDECTHAKHQRAHFRKGGKHSAWPSSRESLREHEDWVHYPGSAELLWDTYLSPPTLSSSMFFRLPALIPGLWVIMYENMQSKLRPPVASILQLELDNHGLLVSNGHLNFSVGIWFSNRTLPSVCQLCFYPSISRPVF